MKHERCGCDKPHREHEREGCPWHDISDADLADKLEELAEAMEFVHDRVWCIRGAMCDSETKIGRQLTRLMNKAGRRVDWFTVEAIVARLRS